MQVQGFNGMVAADELGYLGTSFYHRFESVGVVDSYLDTSQ
jgi:hypothetical protein